MGKTNDSQERREFFRITNQIIINTEVVEQVDDKFNLTNELAQESPSFNLLQKMHQLEKESLSIIENLTNNQGQIDEYVSQMNTKINLLTQFVAQTLKGENHELTEVDLSGGGLRFKSQQTLQIEQLLKIEMVLLPECVQLKAYGKIVFSQPHEDNYSHEIALEFVEISERDRDAIIKHIFDIQSKQIREKVLTQD